MAQEKDQPERNRKTLVNKNQGRPEVRQEAGHRQVEAEKEV